MNLKKVVLVCVAAALLAGVVRRPLVSNLSEIEAQEIAVALHRGNVRAFVSQEGKREASNPGRWKIAIHASQRS